MARTLVAICVLMLLLPAGAAFAAVTPSTTAIIFQVDLDGAPLSKIKSCGSFGSETEVVEFTNGGTGVVTKIPGKTKYLDLVCTENVSTDKTISNWRHDVEVGNFTRKNGTITLLDSSLTPVATYNFTNAWPKSLFIDGLEGGTSTPITETFSIVVDHLSRQ